MKDLVLFNDKEVTKENVLELLKTIDSHSPGSQMTEEECLTLRLIGGQDYEGAEEDLDYLVDTLQTKNFMGLWNYIDANCLTFYDIVSEGNWYYMEEEEMRRKMEKLAERLNGQVCYFTENPINIEDYWGFRYFVCWQNTHTIFKAWETQWAAVEGLQELIEEEIYWCGSHGVKVVK